MCEAGPSDKLAQIIVEAHEVTLYFHGSASPRKIDLACIDRLVISLRDPAGPAVWLTERVEPPVPG